MDFGFPDRIYVHGGRIDEIVADQSNSGVWIYHHYDARGHCILLTDASSNLVEQYSYDAFGKVYYYDGAGNELTDTGVGNRFLFTGREWISDLKLYDFRNRMYQPELGRFIQPDPKEFGAGDYNLYRYCHNDPVNRADPTGLDTEVQLKYYMIEGAGGYAHQFLQMRDTDTGETVISRGGPSEPWRSNVDAILNRAEKSASGSGNIKLQTDMRAAKDSHDAAQNTKTVPGSPTVLKEGIGAARDTIQKLNNAVDKAGIDYKPQTTNSNAYGGTAYKTLTGKSAPGMDILPGSRTDLTNKIPILPSPRQP